MSSLRGTDAQSLLTTLVRVLEDQVLPAVDARSGRSALQLVVGLLDNLGPRVEERAALRRLDDDLVMRLLTPAPAWAGGQPAGETTAAGDSRRLSSAFRALRARPELLSDVEVSRWLQACQTELRRRNDIELTLMRPTRYLTSQRG